MKARHWMPMYWGDYLADTGHFTAAEHGAYLLLIAHYWAHGGLPQDEDAIRRITRLTPFQWSKYFTSLRAKFLEGWRHKRLDEEIAKSLEKSRVNSANAKRRHSERTANAPNSQTHLQPQPQSKNKLHAPSVHQEVIEPVDEPPKAKLFRQGKTLLVSLGISEKRAGSVLGGWLKSKNDPDGILAALQYAADNGVIEPIGYVTRLLANGGTNAKTSFDDRIKGLADQARDYERAAGISGTADNIRGN